MNRRERKNLEKELIRLKKKRNEINSEIRKSENNMKRLSLLIEEAQSFSILKLEDEMDPTKDVKGVYIISKQEGSSITMKHFFNLVRGDDVAIKEINVGDLLKDNPNPLSDDGKPMDFSPGALILVSNAATEKNKIAFNFANVAPSSGTSQIQYEYALSKLGLGIEPKFDRALLAVDGQFRTLLRDRTEGKNEKSN